ncbi:hypothetical protein BH11GEM2_BH11GEM2_26430 [soil metagenome]
MTTLQGRRVAWHAQILSAFDYAQLPDGTWHAATPNGLIGNLGNHQVTEHEDGTITVSPSILVSTPGGSGARWHGYLERGVWRAV